MEDVADAVLFLASKQACHITMHNLYVDGGAALRTCLSCATSHTNCFQEIFMNTELVEMPPHRRLVQMLCGASPYLVPSASPQLRDRITLRGLETLQVRCVA